MASPPPTQFNPPPRHSNVGAGLPAMAFPANPFQPDTPPPNCGSGLARDGVLPANPVQPDTPTPNCGSGLARDGVLPANPVQPDTPTPNYGSGLARDSYLSGAGGPGSEHLSSHKRCSQAHA